MVLVVPDQELTPDQHKHLGQRFSELHVHTQLRGMNVEHPVITTENTPFTQSDGWHSDVTCTYNEV